MANLDVQFGGVVYNPPIYRKVNFAFGSSPSDTENYYKPPSYKAVNFKLNEPLEPTSGNNLSFSFEEEILPNPCEDWVNVPGNNISFKYEKCSSNYWQYSNLITVSFDCCNVIDPCSIKHDVYWKIQPSLALYTNFINCADIPDWRNNNSTNKDITEFIEQPKPAIPGLEWFDTHENQYGNALTIDFDNCDNFPDFVIDSDIDFRCCPVELCQPDYYNQRGNSVNIIMNTCSFTESNFVEQPGNNVVIKFECCDTQPVCDPDFHQYPGSLINVNINSCDENPDFHQYPGSLINVNIDCCTGEPPQEIVFVSGDVQFGEITCIGIAEHVLAYTATGLHNPLVMTIAGIADHTQVITLSGNVNLGVVNANGAMLRGQRVLDSNVQFPPIVVNGEATWAPEVFLVEGNIQLGMQVAGKAGAFRRIDAQGDITLSMPVIGTALVTVQAQGDVKIGEIKSYGEVDITVATFQPSNVIFDNIVIHGEAEYQLVPTTIPSNIGLKMDVFGAAAYIDLPTLWGDINLEMTMQAGDDGNVIEAGVFVYWANIDLKMGVDAMVMHPIYFEDSNVQFGEIKIDGEIKASVAGSIVPVNIGEIIVNRGWVEFGDPQAPEARQIYEASNVRSTAIRSYPLDSKFAIYVPTTDYTVHDVELRRGTVDYTIEFQFDAIQVEKVVVWLVDENGNSVQDSIAKYVGGSTTPHVLAEPFRNLYSLSIPVHCVNDKKYEFYLEVVYESEKYDGTVVFPRKSFLVPFQAHFDNRNPFFNSTDKISSIDANFDSIPDGMLDITTVEFELLTQVFEDKPNIHLSNSFENTWETETFLLTKQDQSFQDITIIANFMNSVFPTMETKYYELDIGQIGG